MGCWWSCSLSFWNVCWISTNFLLSFFLLLLLCSLSCWRTDPSECVACCSRRNSSFSLFLFVFRLWKLDWNAGRWVWGTVEVGPIWWVVGSCQEWESRVPRKSNGGGKLCFCLWLVALSWLFGCLYFPSITIFLSCNESETKEHPSWLQVENCVTTLGDLSNISTSFHMVILVRISPSEVLRRAWRAGKIFVVFTSHQLRYDFTSSPWPSLWNVLDFCISFQWMTLTSGQKHICAVVVWFFLIFSSSYELVPNPCIILLHCWKKLECLTYKKNLWIPLVLRTKFKNYLWLFEEKIFKMKISQYPFEKPMINRKSSNILGLGASKWTMRIGCIQTQLWTRYGTTSSAFKSTDQCAG